MKWIIRLPSVESFIGSERYQGDSNWPLMFSCSYHTAYSSYSVQSHSGYSQWLRYPKHFRMNEH